MAKGGETKNPVTGQTSGGSDDPEYQKYLANYWSSYVVGPNGQRTFVGGQAMPQNEFAQLQNFRNTGQIYNGWSPTGPAQVDNPNDPAYQSYLATLNGQRNSSGQQLTGLISPADFHSMNGPPAMVTATTPSAPSSPPSPTMQGSASPAIAATSSGGVGKGGSSIADLVPNQSVGAGYAATIPLQMQPGNVQAAPTAPLVSVPQVYGQPAAQTQQAPMFHAIGMRDY